MKCGMDILINLDYTLVIKPSCFITNYRVNVIADVGTGGINVSDNAKKVAIRSEKQR